MNYTLYRYTLVATLGGLLFGFDTAVINGALPFMRDYFQLDSFMEGWAMSSALVGCIIGALFVGRPGDRYGRRAVLQVLALLFLLSALGTGLATNLPVFIFFRLLGGLAVGGASVMSPMYIAEIAPPAQRGRLVATSQLAIVVGILTAFFSNFLIAGTGENSWRWMFLAEAVPALAFFLLLFFVARSPRWLVKAGRDEEALRVIKQVNPRADSMQLLAAIRDSLMLERAGKQVNLLKKPYFRLVLIGFAVGMFNQFAGINVIMYYSSDIFQKAGFSSDSALWQTVLIGLTNLGFTVLAMVFIDRFGRKFLLKTGAIGMTFFLGWFALSFMTGTTGGYQLVLLLIGYIAFFAFSQGAVIWVLLSELFPNSIRSRAASIGSFSHWLWNAVITFLFPVVSFQLGVGIVFAFFALATLSSFFFFRYCLTETKGRSLEEIEKDVLNH